MHILPGKVKPTFLPCFIKSSSVHFTATLSNLNWFESFLHWQNQKKMYKARHAFTYLLLKESVANDIINVPLFAHTVCVVCRRPLPVVAGACSIDTVVCNHFTKSSTPRLLHFLFGNSLINHLTPYFFDSRYFYQLSSFINILSF